jgi:4a-hydroxytetrahydrobiopterin dehydratase
MSKLSEQKCIPCSIGTPPMENEEIQKYKKELKEDWKVVDDHHLEKTLKFKNFKEALEFTNRVGEIAEKEGHHPDIFLAWGKVELTVMTHKIDGLSESDFVFAAKVDEIDA